MSSTKASSEHREMSTLTALPLSLQARILGYLCPHQAIRARTNRWKAPVWLPFRDPPVAISLDCGETLTVQLPEELLPPALASPTLAAAAASLLGDRVSYLTHCNTGGQLDAWVEAFAPFVKAVCVRDSFAQWYVDDLRGQLAQDWIVALETQHERSVQLLSSLSIDAVRLEVLDLLDVPFLDLADVEDDLMAGLCAALESNSATLRELALPVFHTSDICDKALEMSSLKKLDVLTVKLWDLHIVDRSKEAALPAPFLRMIRAVDGHADRPRKLTSLRELRLLNAPYLGFDFVTAADRESAVFFTIKTLRVVLHRSTSRVLYETKLFIDLFKNLECLYCNMNPETYDSFSEKKCARLSEVHLCRPRWITTSIQVGAVQHFPDKSFFFGERPSATKNGLGALRSILAGALSPREVRNMTMQCTNLENVSLQVTKENLRAIRKVAERCQQLKCLELVLDERTGGRLTADEWRSLSRVVPKSHKNLCQLAIQAMHRDAKSTPCLDAVFGCFQTTTKALGARAKRLAFRAVFRITHGARIIEKVCGLLNTCIQHTPALESLEFKMLLRTTDTSNYDGVWEQAVVRRLTHLENRILREVESLRVLDLGMSAWLREKIDWNDDTLETSSVSSERGSATLHEKGSLS